MLIEQKDLRGEEVLTHYIYTYDGYGNITTIEGTETTDTEEGISRLISSSMTYDADNRLLTYNGEELQYDADGNMTYGPVDGVMSDLVYDCRKRLVSAGGVTYSYDAENVRIKAETAEYVEEYVTDTVSASLSRVLTMTVYKKDGGVAEATGTTTTYLYGQGLISAETEGNYLYHHYNNLGSTMKLTDAEGQVVESYTYGTYGELLSGDSGLTHYLYNGRCGVSTDANGLYYMRQRYYNPEIKRFINQDILTGDLSNSQSLNQYCYVQGNPVSYTDPFGLSPLNGLFSNTNFAHGFFGLLSCIPGPVGSLASLADGLVYAFVDKDYGMAALCFMDVVAFGMCRTATGLLKANKLQNTAQVLLNSSRIMSNAASFGMCANATMATGFAMYDKYHIQGQAFDSDTKWEILGLGMSILGGVISGRGIAKNTKKLGTMLQHEGFTNTMKGEVFGLANGFKRSFSEFMADNRGMVNLGKSGSYSDTIKWGIHDIEVRPEGKGFWGRRIKQNNSRVDAYELKINPNNESYYLPHPKGGYVQFENMVNSTVQDGKLIMKQKSFYHVEDNMFDFAKNKVLNEAQRQIDAASLAGYKVEWLVSDQSAVNQLQNLFKSNNMDIIVKYFSE